MDKELKDRELYFQLLQQEEDDDIFYAATFTLKKDENGNILLYPDDRYVKKQAQILSHSNVIFEGEIPEMMLIAVSPGLNPKPLHDLLQLRIDLK